MIYLSTSTLSQWGRNISKTIAELMWYRQVNLLRLTLLSRFSRVRLCVTPEMAAHQAPPSLGILQARTLEWVAISFSNAWKWKVKKVVQSCPTLRDPTDCSLPGSSAYGIFQARVLEWVAIAFSSASDHEFLITKFRLKLKKVGNTTRLFSYDLNQIQSMNIVYFSIYLCPL